MSEYKVLHRMQDLGLRISSLYRQEQLAIGILDISSKEALISTLKWYTENMSNIYVMTTQSRMEDGSIQDAFPDVNFIVFKSVCSSGRYINALADECYATYFLVVRSDCQLIAFEGSKLMEMMSERNHPAIICPVMISSAGDILPTLQAPYIKGRIVDPISFVPAIDRDLEEDTLYPMMELGLYDRALFQRLRGYDGQISGEFYQLLDFGIRCHLYGFPIFTSSDFAILFGAKQSIVEDRSRCEGMERCYTKALSIHRIAGKNVVEKWKPYVDKVLLKTEVRTKQIILQKTDFFTLMKEWKNPEET